MNEDQVIIVSKSFHMSKYQLQIIEEESKKRKIPVGRIITLIIDQVLNYQRNYLSYEPTFPTDYTGTEKFEKERKLIFDFISTRRKGIGYDWLYLCRQDIGIEDSTVFAYAFKELLNRNEIQVSQLSKKDIEHNGPDYKKYKINKALSEEQEKRLLKKLKAKYEGKE